VPDDAALVGRTLSSLDPADGLVDGYELFVPADLANRPALVDFEDDDVSENVQEILWLQESVEQDVLGGGRAPELFAQMLHSQTVGNLPLQKVPVRRAYRSVHGAFATRSDQQLDGLEEPRSPQVLPVAVGLLVASELLDRLGFPLVSDRGVLALDHREGDAVDEHHDVQHDVPLCAKHPVLTGDEQLILGGMLEVEEPDGVRLPAFVSVLLDRGAVDRGDVELLVGLGEAGRPARW
jgi:hypothetical protein